MRAGHPCAHCGGSVMLRRVYVTTGAAADVLQCQQCGREPKGQRLPGVLGEVEEMLKLIGKTRYVN